MSQLGCLLNPILLVLYLLLSDHRQAWPEQFLPLAWVPFAIYGYAVHFFDGVQNTSRNIARIYMLEKFGPGYDEKLFRLAQESLIPDNLGSRFLLWQIAGVVSFGVLLVFQGWLSALVAHAALFALGWVVPINYRRHLLRIQRDLAMPKAEFMQLATAGLSSAELRQLVDQAVAERRNPQRWWGEVLARVTSDAVSRQSGDRR